MHAIRTEALIPAPPPAVWAVLTDFDRFHAWNPLNLRAAGKAALGARIPMTILNPVKPLQPLKMSVRITDLQPAKRLEWVGQVPLLFRGAHYFELSPDGSDTRLIHGEKQSGLISRSFSDAQIRDLFVPAYEAMNRALAERVRHAT